MAVSLTPEAATGAVRERHSEGNGELGGHCARCGEEWPCPLFDASALPFSELAESWWQGWKLRVGTREERLRAERERDVAAEVVDEAIDVAPVAAVALLRGLAETAPDEESVAAVGAGPLEQLFAIQAPALRSGDDGRLLEAIEQAARQSREFRGALRGVCFGGDVPSEVMERVKRFLP